MFFLLVACDVFVLFVVVLLALPLLSMFLFWGCVGGSSCLSAGVKRVSACSSRKAPQLHLVISLLSVQSVLSLPRSFSCVVHACLCYARTRLCASRSRPPSLSLYLLVPLILSYLYLSLSVSYLCYLYSLACKSCSASGCYNCLLLQPFTCTFC